MLAVQNVTFKYLTLKCNDHSNNHIWNKVYCNKWKLSWNIAIKMSRTKAWKQTTIRGKEVSERQKCLDVEKSERLVAMGSSLLLKWNFTLSIYALL